MFTTFNCWSGCIINIRFIIQFVLFLFEFVTIIYYAREQMAQVREQLFQKCWSMNVLEFVY